jgi:hypothetical protein
MLISIRIESAQPLTGTAATRSAEPVRFEGWLELLGVIAELVADEQRFTRIERRRDDRTTGEGWKDADRADRDLRG